jgi:hypothetical protein
MGRSVRGAIRTNDPLTSTRHAAVMCSIERKPALTCGNTDAGHCRSCSHKLQSDWM